MYDMTKISPCIFYVFYVGLYGNWQRVFFGTILCSVIYNENGYLTNFFCSCAMVVQCNCCSIVVMMLKKGDLGIAGLSPKCRASIDFFPSSAPSQRPSTWNSRLFQQRRINRKSTRKSLI